MYEVFVPVYQSKFVDEGTDARPRLSVAGTQHLNNNSTGYSLP